MRPAEELGKVCMGGQSNVCTDRAKYHLNLARFRKTALSTKELGVFGSKKDRKELIRDDLDLIYTPNPIFLYDTAQLGDKDKDRLRNFRGDIKEYLGLKEELPPVFKFSPGQSVNVTEQAKRDERKIKICDDKYKIQRERLVKTGLEIREWLLDYFMKSPDVFVSNREHFEEILETYARDPCKQEEDYTRNMETKELASSK
jgi:hypothetical protein